MIEVDLPFAFPIYLLAESGGNAYVTSEFSSGAIGLFAFSGRELAKRFSEANGIDVVQIAEIATAAEAANSLAVAAELGITHVTIDAVAGGNFLTFPIREVAKRFASL